MRSSLVEAVQRMSAEGGAANRLVLESDAGWVLLSAAPGAATLTTVVAAGRHRTDQAQTPSDRHGWLLDNSFGRRSMADPYRRQAPMADADTVVEEAWALFEWVFGHPPDRHALELGERPSVDNHALLASMRAAATDRSAQGRNRLYLAFVRSTLILPLRRAPGVDVGLGVGLDLRPAGALAGRPVAAIFTAWEELERFDPRGLPAVALSGDRLFPLLARLRTPSLLINPRGKVGGELFQHEIETIAEGSRRMQRRR